MFGAKFNCLKYTPATNNLIVYDSLKIINAKANFSVFSKKVWHLLYKISL